VLAIVMVKMAVDGPNPDAKTFLFAEDLSIATLFGAMTNVVYSYTGHWVYFEIIAEMTEPKDFPKVFYINGPLQIGLYLLVACWGYYFAGDQANGYFLDNLAWGAAYRWASFLLFVHVSIAFLIKNVVVARHLHRTLSPARVEVVVGEPDGYRAHAEYVVCAIVVLAGGAVLANAIPFFSQLLGLLGGLLSGPISFLLPMLLFAGAAYLPERHSRHGSLSKASMGTSDGISRSDIILCVCIAMFVILTMVVGTTSVVRDILSRSSYDPPFSCVPLKPH
jgi:amino acid permease